MSFKLYIKETKNNIFVNISDNKRGNVLINLTGGSLQLRGPLRKTPNTAERLGSFMREKLLRNGHINIELIIEGSLNKIIRNVIRGLNFVKPLKLQSIKQHVKMPHNGVRKKKKRRL